LVVQNVRNGSDSGLQCRLPARLLQPSEQTFAMTVIVGPQLRIMREAPKRAVKRLLLVKITFGF
jgi:hypothetical protein